MLVALSIAGFDPSGGAGVLADVKTFASFGCFGAAAVTSLTAQNTRGVFAAYHQSPDVLAAQLEPLAADYEIAAVKVGMLPTAGAVETAAGFIERHQLKNVVVDPVMRSSSGYALIEADAVRLLRERLMPLAELVTPNADEAEFLSSMRLQDVRSLRAAAEVLHGQISRHAGGPSRRAVLIKGGHLDGDPVDVLFDGREVHEFRAPRVASRHTHGTGCALSSAITALLARGHDLPAAVERAKQYVTEAIRTAPGIGGGAGPLNHLGVVGSR
jgi:hydroxymethylpyrimidine/phosphomethylpyrimidine kinase